MQYVIIPLIAIFVAVLGSQFTTKSLRGWYKTLKKPSWTPAGSVIGIVWTTIYTLTSISAILAFNKGASSFILMLFLLNAILNVLWSYVFFVKHQIGGSIIEMTALNITVLALILLIWSISNLAAILLIPYTAWVSFATYLAYSFWIRNKK